MRPGNVTSSHQRTSISVVVSLVKLFGFIIIEAPRCPTLALPINIVAQGCARSRLGFSSLSGFSLLESITRCANKKLVQRTMPEGKEENPLSSTFVTALKKPSNFSS